MRAIALCLFAMLAGCLSPEASLRAGGQDEPIVFVGQLLSVSMSRRDYSVPIKPDAEGRIVVSNSCGPFEATFSVVRSTETLPRHFTVKQQMGEWCDPPAPFGLPFWLVLVDPTSGVCVAAYPLFDDGERLYAVQLSGVVLRDDSARGEPPIFATEPLTRTIPYPERTIFPNALVARRPDLEMTDDGVVITKGIFVDGIFPGLTMSDLFGGAG